MCATTPGPQPDEYPDRWLRDFESLGEIYAFAYGQLATCVEAAYHHKKPREYLREMHERHKKAYRDTLGHYFSRIDYERRREIRAAYRAARHSDESNAQ